MVTETLIETIARVEAEIRAARAARLKEIVCAARRVLHPDFPTPTAPPERSP